MKKIIILLSIIISTNLFCQNDFWIKKFENKSEIESVAFDSKGNIYIGVEYEGIFKSTDNGKTWENKSKGLTLDGINCIAVNSNDVIFSGVSFHGHLIKGPDPLGVFRSTNYGETWELVYETIWINSIVLDSKDNIYVCGNTYDLITDVISSNDDGDTWQKIDEGLPQEYVTEMIIDENEEIFSPPIGYELYKSRSIIIK
jgi:photosystem II stability/assembly factor-like uncharacterized protein